MAHWRGLHCNRSMKIKDLVISYLQGQPLFRERKNKDRGIVNLLIAQYPGISRAMSAGFLTKEQLTAIVQDYASMDRAWRKALEDHAELRGSDYDDKDELEARKMAELGYREPAQVGAAEAVSRQAELLP